MIKHTFLEKCCTIFKDSANNTGLNPVAELNYGQNISRVLIYFNIDELKSLYSDKTICDISKVKHILKLTNCSSITREKYDTKLYDGTCNEKERATSFDILLLKVPKFWDNGKGCDYASDFWVGGDKVLSNDGCNWFQRVNGGKWEENGVYDKKTIIDEYDKFLNNESSFVIGEQHFDVGNENFELDITAYVNNLINDKEKNYGIMLCFPPSFEETILEKTQYVGFFGPYTNTFFHPYLETIYEDPITDDRNAFYIGKTNRLFLYCQENGKFLNLDEIPSCTINTMGEVPVKQLRKGIYYAEFSIKKGDVEEDTILTDTWSNLVLNGNILDPQDFEFVVLKEKNIFINHTEERSTYIPSLTGIIPDENLQIGEIREVDLIFRKKYTTNVCENFDNCFYRLYVKDATNEIDVIPYHPIDKLYLKNQFIINTEDLIPNNYYIDIRRGNNYYRDVLRFKVKNKIENKYI